MLNRLLVRRNNLGRLLGFRRNQSKELWHVLSFHEVLTQHGFRVKVCFWEAQFSGFHFSLGCRGRRQTALGLSLDLWGEEARFVKATCDFLVFWLRCMLVCKQLDVRITGFGQSLHWLWLTFGDALRSFLLDIMSFDASFEISLFALPKCIRLEIGAVETRLFVSKKGLVQSGLNLLWIKLSLLARACFSLIWWLLLAFFLQGALWFATAVLNLAGRWLHSSKRLQWLFGLLFQWSLGSLLILSEVYFARLELNNSLIDSRLLCGNWALRNGVIEQAFVQHVLPLFLQSLNHTVSLLLGLHFQCIWQRRLLVWLAIYWAQTWDTGWLGFVNSACVNSRFQPHLLRDA